MPSILSITENSSLPDPLRDDYALLYSPNQKEVPAGFRYVLVNHQHANQAPNNVENIVLLDKELNYFEEGDVIKVSPNHKSIHTLYRQSANANSFLVTERCNSFCLMCSQPPKNIDDGYLVNEILRAIPLISKDAHEIGLTGGEPTLVGDGFFELIKSCKVHLPDTAVHVLTNGRNFQDIDFAIRLAKIGHPDLVLGIPLYSSNPQIHDFVVQAKGAFDETIRGILNLKRCGVKIEIRCVLHKQTCQGLPSLADYIARNLLFVDHVALMGLEVMGFTRANLDELWIDPIDYQEELTECVEILRRNRIYTSIYNHQLCLLPEELQKYAVKSISDWKNEFLDQCKECSKLNECGGLFASGAAYKHSENIRPYN